MRDFRLNFVHPLRPLRTYAPTASGEGYENVYRLTTAMALPDGLTKRESARVDVPCCPSIPGVSAPPSRAVFSIAP